MKATLSKPPNTSCTYASAWVAQTEDGPVLQLNFPSSWAGPSKVSGAALSGSWFRGQLRLALLLRETPSKTFVVVLDRSNPTVREAVDDWCTKGQVRVAISSPTGVWESVISLRVEGVVETSLPQGEVPFSFQFIDTGEIEKAMARLTGEHLLKWCLLSMQESTPAPVVSCELSEQRRVDIYVHDESPRFPPQFRLDFSNPDTRQPTSVYLTGLADLQALMSTLAQANTLTAKSS